MPKFAVDWSKTYVACGQEIVEADNAGDAEQIVWDNLGNLTGSMNYDGNEDYVEVNEFASDP
jgi:hypothetical protein